MPSPIAHTLITLGCLWSYRHLFRYFYTSQPYKFILIVFVLANAPDWDLIPSYLYKERWEIAHREWGHNIFFAAFLVSIGMYAMKHWLKPGFTTKTSFFFCSLLILGHLFLDLFTYHPITMEYHGVPFFWPLSNYHFTIEVPLFKSMAINSDIPLFDNPKYPTFWSSALPQTIISEVRSSTFFLFLWFICHETVKYLSKKLSSQTA